MDDLSATIAAPETPSTVIDPATDTGPSGGGAPRALPTEEKPSSLRDTIAAVVKEGEPEKVDAKAEKPEAKVDPKAPKVDEEDKPKTERAPDGKFAPRAKVEGEADAEAKVDAQAANDDKAGDPKHYPEPPKNFLADSRETWRNVPRPVRRDIEVMTREHEAFREQATKDTERYESIRPFDDLARSNGRDLKDSLAKITNVENALQRDVVYGLDQVLKEIGPRKQDGSPVSIYELASHIVQQGPQEFQNRMQNVQRSQPAPPDPQTEQMRQQLQSAQEQLVAVQVIEPFKAEHPRYDELKDYIAGFLKSDMIPASLSAPERLEAAYVMAERIAPPSSRPTEDDPAPAPTPPSRAADSLNGSKSIKSAPGAVSSDMEPERGGSIGDILRDEARRMKRA